jgi:hypothetical protein
MNIMVSRGQVDGASAPRPQARQRVEQRAPVRAALGDDQDVLARSDLDPRLLEHSPAAGESNVEILQHQALGLVVGHRDPTRISTRRLGRLQGIAQRHDAQERGAPVGDPRKVVDVPAQRLLNLVESADHHHQPAEGQATAEVTRRRDQDRRDQREPAVPRGHPGQPGEAVREFPHDRRDAIDWLIEDPALLGFAAIERYALGIFTDADQGKAQLRLASVARRIECDQGATDPPGKPGAADSVSERAPHHVARDREAAAADHERDLGRQDPEHAPRS